jgi:murein L,D-transpeptidase YafK
MRLLKLICWLITFSIASLALADDDIWLLIDTTRQQLEIKRGNKTLKVMSNVAIGRNGAGFKQRRGDDITPQGSYTISWINEKSPFYRFYGFNYPSVENANEALLSGLLSKKDHTMIIEAHKNKQIPPQNTRIGGQIGIHGLGTANEFIHQYMNWTHGCIALTNEQIDELDRWIGKGTRVKIK